MACLDTAFMKYLMRAMSDSRLVSAVRGGVSQPAGGGLRLQIVLRSTVKRGGSKPADDTSVGVAGYNLLHCTEVRTPFFRSNCSLECARSLFNNSRRFSGGIMLSNVPLSTREPTLISRRHRRE